MKYGILYENQTTIGEHSHYQILTRSKTNKYDKQYKQQPGGFDRLTFDGLQAQPVHKINLVNV